MKKRKLKRNERNEHPHVGGVFISSRNGAPSRKECVAKGQMAAPRVLPLPPPYRSRGLCHDRKLGKLLRSDETEKGPRTLQLQRVAGFEDVYHHERKSLWWQEKSTCGSVVWPHARPGPPSESPLPVTSAAASPSFMMATHGLGCCITGGG